MLCDTNILIDYLNGEPATFAVLSQWQRERRTLYISVATVTELFAHPLITREEGRIRLQEGERNCRPRAVTFRQQKRACLQAQRVPEDVADNQILAAAAAGNAVCIVSGDTHITRLSVFGDTPILTPQQFLEVL